MTYKKKVNVIIDSRNFTVVGEGNETHIRNLAYYVDDKIKELYLKNERLSQTMAATLAALNIADEYHKTKEELNKLENISKDPLEKFGGTIKELDNAQNKLKEYKDILAENKDTIDKLNKREENLIKEIDKYKDELSNKEEEIDNYKELIKSLQDKNFQNQVDLVEARKELMEYINLLDRETSISTKEGK